MKMWKCCFSNNKGNRILNVSTGIIGFSWAYNRLITQQMTRKHHLLQLLMATWVQGLQEVRSWDPDQGINEHCSTQTCCVCVKRSRGRGCWGSFLLSAAESLSVPAPNATERSHVWVTRSSETIRKYFPNKTQASGEKNGKNHTNWINNINPNL